MSESHKPTSFQIDALLEEEGNKAAERLAREVAEHELRDRYARGSEHNRKSGRDHRSHRNDGPSTRPDLFEGKLESSGSRRGSLVGSRDEYRSNRSSNGLHDESDGHSANRDSRGYRHHRRHRSRSPRRDRSTDRFPDRRGDRHHRDRTPDGRRRHDTDRRRSRDKNDGLSARDSDSSDRNVLSEEQRDKRTVFVEQLAAALRDKDVRRFFEARAGPVHDVQIVRDRHSLRSKGVGYVEFKNEEDVAKALNLTGQKLKDIPIIVRLTEAEKNRIARETPREPTQHGQPIKRLYVGNIDFSYDEKALAGIFESFGPLEKIDLQKDGTGRSKGFAFVFYENSEDCKEALEQMQDFVISGRKIRVGHGPMNSSSSTARDTLSLNDTQRGSDHSGLGGRGQPQGRGNKRDDKAGAASALDDNDVNGVNFANVSRQSLMNKLARKEEPEKTQLTQRSNEQSTTTTNMASRCVCVKNVWVEEDTKEADWTKFLEEDFKAECTKQYGEISHIGIDTSSTEGELYIKFKSTDGSLKAYRGLQRRGYDGRFLLCDYVVDAVYNALFPKAAML